MESMSEGSNKPPGKSPEQDHKIRHSRADRRKLICNPRYTDHMIPKIHIINREDCHSNRHLYSHGAEHSPLFRFKNHKPQHPAALQRDQCIRKNKPDRQIVNMEYCFYPYLAEHCRQKGTSNIRFPFPLGMILFFIAMFSSHQIYDNRCRNPNYRFHLFIVLPYLSYFFLYKLPQ